MMSAIAKSLSRTAAYFAALSSIMLSVWAHAGTMWLAGGHRLHAIDGASEPVSSMSVAGRIVAASSLADGSVWASTGAVLHRLDGGGRILASLDVAQFGVAEARMLVADPYDGALWVAGAGRVLRVDGEGGLLASVAVRGPVRAAALAQDQSLWVLGDARLSNYSRTGAALRAVDVPEIAGDSQAHLAVDSLGGALWLASSTSLVRIDLASGARTRQAGSPGTIRALALEGASGRLWVLGADAIVAYDDRGAPAALAHIDARSASQVVTLAIDPTDGSLWTGGSGGVRRFARDGAAMRAPALDTAISVVAAPPFWTLPRISLVAPVPGFSTTEARPTLALEMDALCSGEPCAGDAALAESFEISASLDGEDVTEEVVRGPASGRASFRPANPLADGTHRFGAVAVDEFGHSSNPLAVEFVVDAARRAAADDGSLAGSKAPNQPPVVAWSSPANGSAFALGSSITLVATASDPDGSVSKVEFLRDGKTVIGTVTAPPYAYVWTSAAAGSYSLTARATDNRNANATSSPAVTVTVAGIVNNPPSVTITGPANGATFAAPADVTIIASASDPDGSIAKIDFYDGTRLLGTVAGSASTLNASMAANGLAPGAHALRAVATDNQGATAVATADIVVTLAPLVVVVDPAACVVAAAPATFQPAASAMAPDATITRVEFYQGGTLIGSTSRRNDDRYTSDYPWSSVPVGTYSITAKAYTSSGASAVSTPVTVRVTDVPVVSLTAPPTGSTFGLGQTITLTAAATDPDGIARIEFYQGGVRVGVAYAPSTSIQWTPAASGTFRMSAMAADTLGATAWSNDVYITVAPNAPPTVSLTAPANGAAYTAPATIALAATASDSDGIATVDFFRETTLLGTVTGAPYAFVWTGVGTGVYSLTARATDALGVSATSAPVTVTVNANAPPSVSLVSPSSGTRYFAPATIALTASATDADGSVARVDFYQGATLLGSVTSAPYTFVWDAVAGGTYTLTAVAVDNAGAATTASPATVTVEAAVTVSAAPGLSGSTVGDDSMLFSGHVSAPPNSGVAVNGLLASVDASGDFYVNGLPLVVGANAITVVVTSQDGQTATQTIGVTSSGAAPFAMTASPTSGLAPLDVSFTVTNRSGVAFQTLEVDLDNNGSAELVTPASSFTGGAYGFAAQYPGGTWTTVARIRDAANNVVFTSTFVVVSLPPMQFEAKLRGVYATMLDRLRAGNIAGALTAVTETVHDKYNAIFTALQPSLATIVDQLGTPQDVTFGDDVAEYSIVRSTPDGPQRFLLYLIRGDDGIWRIEGM